MGFGRFLHLIGSAMLFAAVGLLIVADISAPVVNKLAIFKVDLGDSNSKGTQAIFGTFGYCILGGGADGGDSCTKSEVGYNPASVIAGLDGTDFGEATQKTTKALTNVMVLHAVATALAFIAALLSVASGIIGGLMASLASVATFIVIVVALVCDFVSWSLIKHDIKDNGKSTAEYGPALWCVLAAAALSLLGAVLLFITCCAGRRAKRNSHPDSRGKW